MGQRRHSWFCGNVTAEEYDAYFEALGAQGQDIHGEARFVLSFSPDSVLDGGCGTGRVGRELARHGVEVIGVDCDPDMIAVARRKCPEADWLVADLTAVDLGRRVDIAVLAGNVMIFLTPGTEEAVVHNLARQLTPGGRLIAGFQLGFSLTLEAYDTFCSVAGLQLEERWATWDREPWQPGSRYAVSVHCSADAG